MGNWGLRWAEMINKSSDWEQVAFIDKNHQSLRKIVSQYQIPSDYCYDQIDIALKKTKADALLVTTPFFTHAELTFKGIEAGLHILVEKPMTDSIENARQMIKEAEKRRLILMVAEDFRYNRYPRTIKRLLEEKELGEPQLVLVQFNIQHIFPEGDWRREIPYPLLMENAVHHFDLARYMLSSEALNVLARSWNPARNSYKGDTLAVVTIEMEKEIVLEYIGDWVHRSFETSGTGNWKIWCTKGGICWENREVSLIKENGELITADLIKMEYEGREYILNEFLQSIKNGSVPETSGEDNIKSLAMSLSAIESIRTGREVEVRF